MSQVGVVGRCCDVSMPFYAQVSALAARFSGWSACERTVVVVALLRRLPWPQLRLVGHAVDKALDLDDHHDVEALANDPEYLRTHFAHDGPPPSRRLATALHLLPLLRPDNRAAKLAYLTSAPMLVAHCIATGEHLDLCQEMLSYLLIHPALTDRDRRPLKQWSLHLERRLSDPPPPPPMWPCGDANPAFRRTVGKNVDFKPHRLDDDDAKPDESFSENGTEIVDVEEPPFDPAPAQPKPRRSNSLTPPSAAFGLMSSSSSENINLERFAQKPRSFSLSSEHGLLSSRTVGSPSSSSGSETRLDDLRPNGVSDSGGMSTVAHWLKTLRLHKYVWLFSNLSYEQMMSIDENYLQRLGVTKGARHKLLLSIKKLSERQSTLEDMERELSDGSYVSVAGMNSLLEQLRNIVLSPMKPDSPLAALVVRVLDLASARILSNKSLYHDGSAISLHCWLVDRALSHDAFSRSGTLAVELKSLKYRVPPRQFLAHLGDVSFQRRSKPRYRNCISTTNWLPKESSRKSSSYPSFPSTPPLLRRLPPAASMGDINSRLESLCLQMTEQAIN